MLSHDYLKSILWYNPETGEWVWIVNYKRNKIGDKAGFVTNGYLQIRIDGVLYYSHRLAWFYMTGEWPKNDIDHKDTDRSNDRWENLREATRSQNNTNVNVQKNNRVGVKGISQVGSKFVARLVINGKYTHLGTFDTLEKAAERYELMAKWCNGEFART